MGIGIANLSIRLKATVDDYNKTMATARETIQNFEQSAIQAGRSIRNVGYAMTAMSAIGTAAMTAVSREAYQLNEAYRELNTLMESNRDSQDEFRGMAEDLTDEYAVQGGQIEVVQGAYEALSAGVADTEDEVRDFLETNIELSTVGLAPLQETIELTALSLNTYNLEAEDTEAISDTLFTVVEEGAIRFEELAGSFGTLLPFANDLNVQFEEIGATMAFMSREFDSARRAAFAIRSTMQQLADPGDDLAEAFYRIGMETNNLPPNMQELQYEMEEQQRELRGWQDELNETQHELSDLQAQNEEWADDMRENRIRIQEIRLEAREQGRDLTRQEESEIEDLEIANDSLRLERMRQEQKIDDVQDEEEELTSKMEDTEDEIEDYESQLEVMSSEMAGYLVEQESFAWVIEEVGEYAEESANVGIQDLITNQRALQFILPMLNDEQGEFASIMESMEGSPGTVAENFDQFNESIGSEYQRALQNVRDLMAEIGDYFIRELNPTLQTVNDVIHDVSDAFGAMDEELRENIAQFIFLSTAILAILGPIFMFIGTVVIMIGLLGKTLIPMFLGAAVAIGLLYNAFEDIQEGGESAEERLEDFASAIDDIWQFANDLADIFSEHLLPSIRSLGDAISTWISTAQDAFGELSDESTTLTERIETIAETVGNVLDVMAEWLEANDHIIHNIVILVGTIAQQLVGALQELLPGLMEVIRGIIDPFAALLGLFGDGEDGTSGLVDGILSITGAFFGLVEVIGGILQRFGRVIGQVIGFFALLLGGYKIIAGVSALVAGLSGVISVAHVAVAALIGFLSVMWGMFLLLIDVLKGIVDVGRDAFNFLASGIDPLVAAIQWGVDEMMDKFDGLMDIIDPQLTNIFDAAMGFLISGVLMFANYVDNYITLITGIFSAFIGFIQDVFIALWQGSLDDVIEALETLVGDLLQEFRDFIEPLEGVLENVLEAFDPLIELGSFILSKFTEMFEDIQELLEDAKEEYIDEPMGEVKSAIVDPIDDLIEDAYDWGSNLIDEFIDGIKSQFEPLEEAFDEAAEFAGDTLGINSDAEQGPLSNLTQWGPNLIETFAGGIEGQMDMVDSALGELPGFNGDDMKMSAGGSDSGGGSTVVDFQLLIEQGAFQGVAEEELPRKISDEVDDEFDQILDKLKAAGKI